jgi:hypothetical protein
MRTLKLSGIILLALGVALILSCSSDVTSPGNGSLQVYITDAPIDFTGVSAVNVTFSGIVLYPEDDNDAGEVAGSMDLDISPAVLAHEGTINLLDYQDGAVIMVGSADIPAGTYSRIRLLVSEVNLVEDDDGDPETPEVVEPVKLSSGKIDIHFGFTVGDGEEADVILDFDAAESVHINETGNGKYILRPVVNHISTTIL